MSFDADDDDFFTSDDDLAIDNEVGLVGEAKNSLLESMERVILSMKKNIQFNEDGDFKANLSCLSSFMTHLIDLDNIEGEEDFSNEELMEKINQVMRATTVLTMSNIDSIIPEEEEETQLGDSATDEAGTDW